MNRMFSLSAIQRFWVPAGFIVCLLPMVWILLQIFEVAGLRLGPNPIEDIQDFVGGGGLRLIMLTLAMTPLRKLTGKPWPLRFRRMLGLFAFTYCLLHFLNYLVLDQSFEWSAIAEDIITRPFITIGFSALLLMVPLAITSTNKWRRRLGRRWNMLHRLVYVTGIAACWHYYWLVKKDVTEPLIYIGILTVLLGIRVFYRYSSRSASTVRTPVSAQTANERRA